MKLKRFFAGMAAALLAAILFFPCKVQAVSAQSAVLMDVETGTVLYEQNAHERLAPASVTKVMTMLLIMEAIDDGRIKLSDIMTA